MRRKRLRKQESRGEIGAEDGVPVRKRKVGHQTERGNAGRMHEPVNPSELRKRFLHHPVDECLVGKVTEKGLHNGIFAERPNRFGKRGTVFIPAQNETASF